MHLWSLTNKSIEPTSSISYTYSMCKKEVQSVPSRVCRDRYVLHKIKGLSEIKKFLGNITRIIINMMIKTSNH